MMGVVASHHFAIIAENVTAMTATIYPKDVLVVWSRSAGSAKI